MSGLRADAVTPGTADDRTSPSAYTGAVDGVTGPAARSRAVQATAGQVARTEAAGARALGGESAEGVQSPGGIGAVPVEALRSQNGLAVLRGILAGELPRPPITETLGFTLAEVGPGLAVFTSTPDERLYNPMGAVHGGFAMTLLDSAMTCAVLTALAAGEGCTTVETKVNFVRPMLASTGPVRAEGRLLHAGARVATAEGRLVDAAGRLYAHGTTTCLRFPL